MGRFLCGLQRFFHNGLFFQMQFSLLLLGGATIFAKLRSKIAKSPRIGEKDCAHHYVYIAEGFGKNLLQ